MNQQVFTLNPPTGSLPYTGLGFYASSVIVDNYTSSYVNISDAGVVLPPWVYGAVVTLPVGINQAKANLTATTPSISGPPVPSQTCTLIWTDADLPASSGHLLQQSGFGVQQIIGTVSGAHSTTQTQTLAVPSGTMSIGYLVRSDAGNDTPQLVTIQGTTSFNDYVQENPLNNIGGPNWFPFAASDSSVLVTLQTNAANPSSIDVLASPLVESTIIKQTPSGLLNVVLTDPVQDTSLQLANISSGVWQLVTTQVTANPAPWQAAKKNAAVTIASVASGGTQTLIAASGGVTIYLHDYSFSQDNANAAANWQLQDTSGTLISSWFDTNVRKVFASGDFGGFPLTTGVGVRILNGGVNASFIGGFLSYSTG